MDIPEGFVEASIDGYRILIFSAWLGPICLDDGNLDVEVIRLEDGTRFLATVFTLSNIKRLMREAEERGDDGRGLYFWCVDLVVLPDLSVDTIVQAVSELVKNGELHQAFQEIPSNAGDLI